MFERASVLVRAVAKAAAIHLPKEKIIPERLDAVAAKRSLATEWLVFAGEWMMSDDGYYESHLSEVLSSDLNNGAQVKIFCMLSNAQAIRIDERVVSLYSGKITGMMAGRDVFVRYTPANGGTIPFTSLKIKVSIG